MMGPNGGHFEARAITVARLGELISRYVARPVIDETHVDGIYDFSLDVSPDELGNMAGGMKNMMATASAMAASNAGPGGGRGGPDAANASEAGGSIFQSVQSYGLKLEPKKAPVEMIVIDSAEKAPTEN